MSDAAKAAAARTVKSYVIRSGRMTDAQKEAYAALLPRYGIDPGDWPPDPRSLFPGAVRVIVEIGFGMGAATLEMAAAQPETGFIGIEVHRPGIGKLMMEAERLGLNNLRVAEGDAIGILENCLIPGSLDGIHLYFPDPWPKKRHHKRRIVQAGFCALAASRLRPGSGYIHMVTDDKDYAEAALAAFEAEPLLANAGHGFIERPAWRPLTKFERRALDKGQASYDMLFTRRA